MLPLISQCPFVGSKTPAIIFSIVDLPDPLVPIMPKTSPFFTTNDMSSSAVNPSKNNSRRAILMRYSFKLFNCSDAMLKTMETWSTLTMSGRLSTGLEVSELSSERADVLTFSGIMISRL